MWSALPKNIRQGYEGQAVTNIMAKLLFIRNIKSFITLFQL
jgi:hypothetical protein